jgi:hypothetical protein
MKEVTKEQFEVIYKKTMVQKWIVLISALILGLISLVILICLLLQIYLSYFGISNKFEQEEFDDNHAYYASLFGYRIIM